ncbi:uncharacterized protein NCBP2-AS2 homolog [Lingula anatina]|uniref:Uncharacterized protein NCBP2-AS2 homolog n=1 Tax=Lingula anatina TaxID=7574 RepID=A0A1S3IVG2_LINAN|nr:uncharacterized protein NCBP2-AS2 homolog [Lingula anatina]|eukprot:XP_013401951.1 uncharacterized protein NCBP2-AS2 homolog [Lingula anatina]
MPWRQILRQLLNNPHLEQKLADSYIIRRAAQITAYFMHRGKQLTQDKVDELAKTTSKTGSKLDSFKTTFAKELKREWDKEKKKLK